MLEHAILCRGRAALPTCQLAEVAVDCNAPRSFPLIFSGINSAKFAELGPSLRGDLE